jgi:hypothetical protein
MVSPELHSGAMLSTYSKEVPPCCRTERIRTVPPARSSPQGAAAVRNPNAAKASLAATVLDKATGGNGAAARVAINAVTKP